MQEQQIHDILSPSETFLFLENMWLLLPILLCVASLCGLLRLRWKRARISRSSPMTADETRRFLERRVEGYIRGESSLEGLLRSIRIVCSERTGKNLHAASREDLESRLPELPEGDPLIPTLKFLIESQQTRYRPPNERTTELLESARVFRAKLREAYS